MLVDNIIITVQAGNGGDGSAHLRRDGQTAKGGPDGGHGGNGGSVYMRGSHNLTDLREFRFKKIVRAQHGENGKKQNMIGKNAPDITIIVPIGTRITDQATNAVLEITDDKKEVLIARGGRGGLGNIAFKSPTNRTPREFEKGKPGEQKQFLLELRLIADIGLVGLPNAGKSSLLSRLTRANPAIGAYPFTTLEPNLGMLDTYAIADIPGLIAGASRGKGLGIDFLKHIEKTKILIHCIDLTNPSPKKTYDTVRREFSKFNSLLTEKAEYILLTKTDLVDSKVIKRTLNTFTKLGKTVWTCSVYDEDSITKLKEHILTLLRADTV
jgi:GTPase